MKLVSAVVKPFVLDGVREAVRAAGASGITVTESFGFGRAGACERAGRAVDVVPRVRVEVLVPDEDVARAVEAIVSAARTGTVGDATLWVTDVEAVYRVRTGEAGNDAI